MKREALFCQKNELVEKTKYKCDKKQDRVGGNIIALGVTFNVLGKDFEKLIVFNKEQDTCYLRCKKNERGICTLWGRV